MFITCDPDGDLVLVLIQELELEGTNEVAVSREVAESLSKEGYMDDLLPNEPSEDVHMLVSSRHMSLASPVFRAMLQRNNFKEGRELAANDLLSRISTLADKYQLHEVVEIMPDRWISQPEPELPEEFTDDLLLWLRISWVFEKPSIFKEVTRIAERQSNGRIGEDRDDIPIPNRMQERRITAITDAYSTVETILNTGKHHCTAPRKDSFECSGMVLGTLLQSSTKLGISPVPDLTDTSLTFNYVINQIRKVEVFALCDKISPFKGFEYDHWSTHGVKQAIDTVLVIFEKRLSGLEMGDLKKGKRAQTELKLPARVKTKTKTKMETDNLDLGQLSLMRPA